MCAVAVIMPALTDSALKDLSRSCGLAGAAGANDEVAMGLSRSAARMPRAA